MAPLWGRPPKAALLHLPGWVAQTERPHRIWEQERKTCFAQQLQLARICLQSAAIFFVSRPCCIVLHAHTPTREWEHSSCATHHSPAVAPACNMGTEIKSETSSSRRARSHAVHTSTGRSSQTRCHARFNFTNMATISCVLLLFIQMFLFMTALFFICFLCKQICHFGVPPFEPSLPDSLMSSPVESISHSPNNFLFRVPIETPLAREAVAAGVLRVRVNTFQLSALWDALTLTLSDVDLDAL